MASGQRTFGRSTRRSAKPVASAVAPEVMDDEDAEEYGSIDERADAADGHASRLSAQPVEPPKDADACDSDDTPDDGSVAERAASLLSISMRRRRPAAAPPPRRAAPPKPRNLSECWMLARRNRAYPTPADIEDGVVTGAGYQGVLVRCGEDGRFLQVRRVFGSPMPEGASPDGMARWDDQNTAMVLEWLSTLGREAVRAASPIEAADMFPSRRAGVPWRAIVLPLSTNGDAIDTLLCCVRIEPER